MKKESNITVTKKALREFVSDFIDDNLLYFLINKYNECECEPEKETELTNPSEVGSTIGKDESKPINPVDEYGEQYVENVLRKEVLKIIENKNVSPEDVAKFFHKTYEELAPQFNYETKKESAVPWTDVPESNKKLMVAVAEKVVNKFIKDEN